MKKITVDVGSYNVMSGGHIQDNLTPVEFTGENVFSVTDYHDTDTRGCTETLYRLEDGRLFVYVAEWSHWQGEPNVYTLHEVEKADLEHGGMFERLGQKAGFGRPLTVDEAKIPIERF